MRLKDINITHISLVKAGANKRGIIYKSANEKPTYEKDIKLIKTDLEKGIVYGIVYSPDDVDTQGDSASADEIVKAAYEFMKSRNTLNVDKEHSFKVEKAFVCESWIIKANDPLFPNEKEGTWAVGIKLDDEELKEAVKKGDIAGLSMAGNAVKEDDKTQTTKSESFSLKDLTEAIKKAFTIEKNEGDETLDKEKLQEVLKEATKPLHEEIATLKKSVEDLTKENDEVKEELKKSKQRDDFRKSDDETTTDYEGVL